MRAGDWKYLKVGDREFLFDIGWDPRERSSVAHKHPELVDRLRREWVEWERQMLPVDPDFALPALDLSGMLW